MATVTRPDTDLPNPGDVMDAAQVTDWTNNVLTFLESTNIDEANVDLTGSDGIVGKSTAQTLTGLKTFNNNSAAAGGVRTAGKFQHIPGSGTVADNDGVELQFQGYNDAGTPETITYGEIETVFTDVSDGSEDADMEIDVSDKISKYEEEQVSEMVLNALIKYGVEVGKNPEFSWELKAEVWIEGGTKKNET